MTTEITWQEPPPDPRGRWTHSKWAEHAEALRKNPGRWVLLTSMTDASLVTAIKRGRRGFSPAGAFEARSVAVDGKRQVFARYVGEQVSA